VKTTVDTHCAHWACGQNSSCSIFRRSIRCPLPQFRRQPNSMPKSTRKRRPTHAIVRYSRDPEPAPLPERAATAKDKRSMYIVGMGGSAGALEAFEEFFAQMPLNSGLAFVLIPHLDPNHKGMMPEILKRSTGMPVMEASEGTVVRPNCLYIIPPNKDMRILQGRLQLADFTAPRGARSPIDFFFYHLAEDQGSNAVAVIMSGMGNDGTLGVKAIKEHLGLVLAQEPSEARYDSMPKSVIATGLVDYVAPARELPGKLLGYVIHAYTKRETSPLKQVKQAATNGYAAIMELLRRQTAHDFLLYKKNTIMRRIERRMHVHQIGTPAAYAHFLQNNPHETELLFKELLIGVTGFFREPESFQGLMEKVLPSLLKKKVGHAVRVWVPGCSTGEEAYSLAIVIFESLERLKLEGRVKVQIFATDINQEAIDRARQGFYGHDIESAMSTDRLQRSFVKEDNGYRLRKAIREMVVFAPQNFIADPPFTKMDLVSCRNVLIYLTAELQKKLIPLFHYALAPGGILFLGSSETIGGFSDLFTTIDSRWKIYERRDQPMIQAARPDLASALLPRAMAGHKRPAAVPTFDRPLPDLSRDLLLQRFAPPAVLVNESGEILYVYGKTGQFLEPASGEASLNLFSMAREGLRLELGRLIKKALLQNKETTAKELRVQMNGGYGRVNVTVHPLFGKAAYHGLSLVTFEAVPAHPEAAKSPRPIRKSNKEMWELEQELATAREHLQTTIEGMNTTQEELKSANEELQSMNEELQSTNEELTTSKEEMQSMNEELVTVNSELQDKIEELSQANSDMKNLLNSTDLATVFVDNDLNVKRFTPQTAKVVNLIPGDVGRPLTDITTNWKYERLADDIRHVLDSLISKEQQIQTKSGQWFLMRISPYRTLDNVIDGAVLTFTNITQMKQLERSLGEKEELTRRVLEHMPVMLAALGPDHRCVVWNQECEAVTGYAAAEILGGHNVFLRLLPDPAYREQLLTAYQNSDGRIRNWVVRITCKDGRVKTIAVSSVSRPISVLGWREWGIGIDVSDLRNGPTSAED
jgi:two-component system CheB/CheR fusion protein